MTITEAANVVVALSAFGTFLLALWINHRVKRAAVAIEEVHVATNSMKDELVAEVREASLAKGLKQGRAETRRKNP